MKFCDNHCHLNSPELRGDIAAVLERARAAGVTRMGVIGSTVPDSAEAVALCREFPESGLFAVVGVHPHEASTIPDGIPPELLTLASQPEVRAWGEIGLDYWYDLSPRPTQMACLAAQLEAAKALNMRVVFHVRDAYDDFWKLMTPERAPVHAEVHCFTGEEADARRALERGWKLGVTGMMTFKSCGAMREILKKLPLDSLLSETDAPWLAPVPFRGRTNEPSRIPLICRALAELKSLDVEEVAARLWRSSAEFWGFPDAE